MIRPIQRNTINKKSNSFVKQQTKVASDFKEKFKKLKHVDPRCDDEIDELKKIFYRFFGMTGSLTSSADPAAQNDQFHSSGGKPKVTKQYQKDTDSIKIQLKELYEEKDKRDQQRK